MVLANKHGDKEERIIGRMVDIDEEEALVDKCLISWGEVSVDSHGWGWGWSTMSSKTLEI